jgi:hypothetical protein
MRKTIKAPVGKKQTIHAIDPAVDETASYHRQKAEAILRRHQSLDSANELLGWDIISAAQEGIKKARITKTRSFSGIGKRTGNRDGMTQEAGHIYIMKFRSTKFLNITTGREGDPSCVWIEEAMDVATGKQLKSGELVRFLGMENSDRQPIFSAKSALVPGAEPIHVIRLSPSKEKASENTTGIFEAIY